MNRRQSILAVAFILTLCQSLYGQGNFRLNVVGGAALNTLTTGVFSNWGDGWTFGSGLMYPITPSVELGVNITYSRFPYQGDNLQLAAPDVVGFRWSVAGKSSNVIEASATARASTNALFINHFLSITAGLYRFNTGDIIISTWSDSNPQNVSKSRYNPTGVSTTKVFAAFGFGFSIPIDSSVRVGIEGRLTQTFVSRESFIPLLAGIQFDL